MVAAESNQGSAQKTILKRVVKDSAFPAFVVFVVLIAVNFYFQDRFFTYRILRSSFMAYTPLILISMAQAIIIISGLPGAVLWWQKRDTETPVDQVA